MNMNKIYKVDLALIVGTLIIIVLIMSTIGYRTPYVISPKNNFSTSENQVLFSFENADSILIDKNRNFSSPKIINVEDDIIINLEPGVYYWMLRGLTDSEVRRLDIKSRVELKLISLEDGYGLKNIGNTDLNIEIHDNNTKENIDLDKGQERKVNGTKFIGSQK